MRLERIREAEMEQRRGLAWRTLAQLTWLGISVIIAYYITNILFEQQTIVPQAIYADLNLPGWVPDWALFAFVAFCLVMVLQFLMVLGYFFGSSQGRRRSGKAISYSDNPDPSDIESRY